jgi:hypothetical protein
VRAKLTSLLAKCLTKQWKLFEETPMRRTELQLQPVSVECMIAAERLPQGHQGDPVSVENLQPDMVLVSQSLKRIGLLDLCRPFDSLSEQLAAALRRKLCTYGPLLEALRVYVADGWQVKILPWVVGVRGMIDEKSVSEVLNFLQVPRTRRTRIIEDVTTESVKALYSLHQIRYLAFRLNMHKTSAGKGKMTTSGMVAANRHGAFDTDDPSSSYSGKRRGRADDDYGEKRRRWKKMASEAKGRS